MHPRIMDRFDLTLECIRRWYQGIESPLQEHIERYASFFQLFMDFRNYCSFFLLEDLVDEDNNTIRFWLPFENFGKVPPVPANLDEYLEYKKGCQNSLELVIGACRNTSGMSKLLMTVSLFLP